MSNRIYKASIQQADELCVETRVNTEAIGTISVKQGGIVPILLQTLFVNQRHRHQGSIRRLGIGAFRNILGGIITAWNFILFYNRPSLVLHIEINDRIWGD